MVIKMIIKKYKIEKKNVVAHSDIAPLRKMDPGEKFPWQLLAKKNIGIWYNVKKNLIKNKCIWLWLEIAFNLNKVTKD